MKAFFSFDPKLLLYGFVIIFFASYGQTFFISIFNAEIRNFYQLSDGEFGLVYALSTLTSSFMLVWFVKLIDRIDLRIYSLIISCGLALACFGMFLLIKQIFFLFLIIFTLRFFGQGAMGHAGETSLARYFDKDRGKAISVGTFGGMFGVMILPILAVYIMNSFDWYTVWLIASFSILIVFFPILIFSLHKQNIRHNNFINTIKHNPDQKNWKIREIILDKKFYIYLPISIATPFVGTGLQFHQIFIINQKGWTLDMLAQGFVSFGMFSIIGLIIGGPIIDKFDTKKTVIYSLLPLFITIIVLIFFDNYISIFIYMSLLGFTIGIGAPFIGALWAELYGLENLGSIKGLLHASMVFASALSPVIFGLIIDIGFGILTISIISLLIIAISTFLPLKYEKQSES